ncbi:mechanosensitive ion channel protein [Candidatus Endobugula sertula]|uniref:Small-conductance mechanosensitive channel n=1 Tax=Candidatus Endobugula sertula TaxID=62101 RepID=A0A1D2QU87_9GAMM|nr:mechanosensitive ion channel protein [Candidatus Endobugula sertula]
MTFSAVMALVGQYSVTYTIKILIALAIFIIGKWLAKKISTLIRQRLGNNGLDPTLTQFVQNILYYLLLAVVIIAALGQLGIQTASFVAIVGAAGLAIGLALQGSLANFAAGVLIILFRPIKVGDFVEVSGVSGSVSDISIFATTLLTGDNKTVIIANADVTGGNIINFSTQPTRRIDLVVGVAYDSNIQQVKDELKALADADERVLKDKVVTIGVVELADSSVNLVFRPWVNSADYWSVYFDLNENIKNRFDELGIGIPYPTMDVNVSKS